MLAFDEVDFYTSLVIWCVHLINSIRPHIKFKEDEDDDSLYNVEWLRVRIVEFDCVVLVGVDDEFKNKPFY